MTEVWDDHVHVKVANIKELQKDLVELCNRHHQAEACHWADKFKLQMNEVHVDVAEGLERIANGHSQPGRMPGLVQQNVQCY